MVCFGGPARIWFWNLKINKPVSEPKCAQINVYVKENGQFWKGPPESSFGASKWRIQPRRRKVFEINK